MSDLFDVFISYAHADRGFVLDLQLRLERKGLHVWMDQKQILLGQPVQPALVEALENCRHVILVITEQWTKSEWTIQEANTAHRNKGCSVIPVFRVHPDLVDKKKLPIWVMDLSYLGWWENEDPDEQVAKIFRSVTAGPTDRPERIGPTPSSRSNEEADSEAARRAKLGLADAPLYCNRTKQWDKIKDCAARLSTEALFVQGTRGQGQETFVARVEMHLPTTPPRFICPVPWERWKNWMPDTPAGFLEALALAVEHTSGTLEDTLKEKLSRGNVWFVHRPVLVRRLKEREDLFVQYYTEILPALIERVVPNTRQDEGSWGIKVVQGIAWCPISMRASFVWLAARLGLRGLSFLEREIQFREALQRLEMKRALREIQRKAHRALPIVRLKKLKDIQPDDVRELCSHLELQPDEHEGFLEEVLLGARSSAEILDGISKYQFRKEQR